MLIFHLLVVEHIPCDASRQTTCISRGLFKNVVQALTKLVNFVGIMFPVFCVPAESSFFLFFRPYLTELFALDHKFDSLPTSEEHNIYAFDLKSKLERTLEAKIS